jgi:hypothetical protein
MTPFFAYLLNAQTISRQEIAQFPESNMFPNIMFRLCLIHILQEINCTGNVPTLCLCAINAVNKQTLYSWISDLNVLQPHFSTQKFKYIFKSV